MSTQSLNGKKAMVIGGSRGIGAAVVKRLAREGAAVAFTYVSSRAPAEALATSIEDAGGHATALHADSADAKALDVAVDRAAEALGGLDILVNNAGILIHGNVADYSLADFDKMIAVNVRGVFVAAKAAARHLPPGGKMIVIGSNTARRAMVPGAAVYGMTKAAVARLVQGLALDFAEKKIAVIDVQPGPTATDMAPKDEARRAWLANASPEKRIADADEIARFVTYLASPLSTYINGVSLTIDGGFSA
jgi:3-oxoacyl-[acyl-carrier protein] reductase